MPPKRGGHGRGGRGGANRGANRGGVAGPSPRVGPEACPLPASEGKPHAWLGRRLRIKRVTEAGARRYVNACIVYHDPSESHPFHVMHDDGTHAWIAIVDRSRVVHVNDPGNRKRVTRDFTWVTPERGTREAAAAAMMDQPTAAYGHAMDTGLSIPPGMLGQWNLGYGGAAWGGAVGANAGFDPSPIAAANMGPNPAGHHGHVAIPPRSRLGLNLTQAAVNNRRTTGDWEHRLLREFAVNLPLEEEEDPPAPSMNALAPQPTPRTTNNESLVQAGFLVPRQQVGADQARGLTGAPAQVPTPGTRVDQETAPSVKRAADEDGAEKAEDQGGAKRRRAATDDGGDDDEEKEEEEGEIDLLAAARAVGAAAAAATLAGRPGSEHHPTDLEGSSEDEEEETVAGSERDDGVGGSDDDDVEEQRRGGGEGGGAGEEGEAAGGDTDAAVAK